jgi:hypothetical protein
MTIHLVENEGVFEAPVAEEMSFFQKVWNAVKNAATTVAEYFIGAIMVDSTLTKHAMFAACLTTVAVISPVLFAHLVVVTMLTFALSLPMFLAIDMWTYHQDKKAFFAFLNA